MELSTSGGSIVTMELSALGWLRLVSAPASVAANRIFLLSSPNHATTAMKASSIDPLACRAIPFLVGSEDMQQPLSPARETTIKYVAEALVAGNSPTVEQLAKEAGVHSRTLYRYCMQAFGFGPMTLLKRQRLLRTLQRMRDPCARKLAEIIPLDYYDQAHFNRDFKAVMGATPSEYRGRSGGAAQTKSLEYLY